MLAHATLVIDFLRAVALQRLARSVFDQMHFTIVVFLGKKLRLRSLIFEQEAGNMLAPRYGIARITCMSVCHIALHVRKAIAVWPPPQHISS